MFFRNKNKKTNRTVVISSLIILLTLVHCLFPLTLLAAINGTFMYTLADFTGTVPLGWVPVTVDKEKKEVYVVDSSTQSIRIFNDRGMQVFSFGDDPRLGSTVRDIAVLSDGDILLLSYFEGSYQPTLVRCNYRGEPEVRMQISGLSQEWAGFKPNRLITQNERLYLADSAGMRVAITDLQGKVISVFDLSSFLDIDSSNAGLNGFSVDDNGRLLFTVPVMFKAFRLDTDGHLDSFGRSGSTAGRFGVVSGITSDDKGHIFVTDTLRCVIMIFDKNLSFIREFGYRSLGPEGLIAPKDLVMGNNGKIYVTRMGSHGVGTFVVSGDD